MPHPLAQRGADRSGVTIVAVGRDPIRCHPSHHFGGAEERLGRCHVPVLAKQHVDQGPVPVDGAIQKAPAPVHFQVCLILSANATAYSGGGGDRGAERNDPVADRPHTALRRRFCPGPKPTQPCPANSPTVSTSDTV